MSLPLMLSVVFMAALVVSLFAAIGSYCRGRSSSYDPVAAHLGSDDRRFFDVFDAAKLRRALDQELDPPR